MKATISNLTFNPKKALDSATKRQLQMLIETEYRNQCNANQAKIDEKKRLVLEAYKKQVGFDKLTAKVSKAEAELNLALNNLYNVGLNKSGEINHLGYGEEKTHPEREESIKKVQNLLNQITMDEPDKLRNKIVTRLWLASTIGEAIVIVNEVMGNHIIPTLDVKQLSYEETK